MSFWCWNHVSMINIVTYHLVSKQTILYSDPLCLSIGSSFIFTQAPLSAPPLVITVKNCSDCQMIFCWSRSSPGLQSTGISNGFYFFQNQQNLIIFVVHFFGLNFFFRKKESSYIYTMLQRKYVLDLSIISIFFSDRNVSNQTIESIFKKLSV
jgi:hypothetical protein